MDYCPIQNADAEVLPQVDLSENPGEVANHLYFYRQGSPWYICLVRQANEASFTSNSVSAFEKNMMLLLT